MASVTGTGIWPDFSGRITRNSSEHTGRQTKSLSDLKASGQLTVPARGVSFDFRGHFDFLEAWAVLFVDYVVTMSTRMRQPASCPRGKLWVAVGRSLRKRTRKQETAQKRMKPACLSQESPGERILIGNDVRLQ